MANAFLTVQNYLDANTLLPRDRFVNIWHVLAPDTYSPANITTLMTAFGSFYATQAGARLAAAYLGTNGHVKVYNDADPKPRAPIGTYDYSLGTVSTSDALPPEVCMCLSFKGSPLSGVRAARQRGRIYLGPLTANTMVGGLFTSANRAAVTAGAITLNHAIAGIGSNWNHIVWSKKQNNYSVVTQYWIDDEADHQKRRQRPSVNRTVVTP